MTQSIAEQLAAKKLEEQAKAKTEVRPVLVPKQKIMTNRRGGFQMGNQIIRADVRGVLPNPVGPEQEAEYKSRIEGGVFYIGTVYEEAPAEEAAAPQEKK